MKLVDERIINYVRSKHNEDGFDLEKFLNPTENDLRDAKLFKNIDLIVSKIKEAIDSQKKILIYGDYDSDGICSTTILYLYLKSQNANVDVFIPNRFENGYGISVEAIEEIVAEFAPNLIITVDLGITAVEEIEILKQEDIEVIVTDHHLPLDEVPDCLILDPKYDNEDYGFDALCGAGVAMKLVETLGGKEESNKFLDIAGVATVGDIVPLVDENRTIAKLGIDKINKGDCLPSLTFIKNKLDIAELTSTDISFKIVPRLNACGRMDNALKVFDFLIETDNDLLEEKYAEIESDNSLRLASIDKGYKTIEKCLDSYDINEPSVLIAGDFHEGIIGILASRVCHEFNKPTIIFTKTEDGTLKGSGRSIESIDLHKIISSMTDILENFGGHKMAVGVEIAPDVFDVFKEKLNEKIKEESSINDFLINSANYDIEITEEDFNERFVKQVNLLEPFGCENEKPVFAIRQTDMIVEPVSEKAFKHFRCFTKNNHPIVGFNYHKFVNVCKSKTEKLFLLDLSLNTFKGKTSVSALAKGIDILKVNLNDDEDDFLAALYNLYYSIFDFNNKEKYHVVDDLKEIIKQKFSENCYGTIVVATTAEDLKTVTGLGLEKYVSATPYTNAQNCVVVSPIYALEYAKGYKNIIFLHKYFNEEHLYFSQKMDVFEPAIKLDEKPLISKDRGVSVQVYKHASNFAALKANDVVEFAKKLAIKDTSISSYQILFSLIVFMELNFLEFDDVLNCMKILKAKKVELSSSKFFNIVE